MARALPRAELRPYVHEYVGWWDHSGLDVCRRELPGDLVPIIINFGSPVKIYANDARTEWREFDSFTTGVFDTYVLVGTSGLSGGLQINLTIPGARVVLGAPLGELLNTVVSLADVFGASASSLASQLFDAPDWASRFAIVERELMLRVARVKAPAAAVMHSSARLLAADGRVPISALAQDAGCSQKHLIAQFRRELGVTPKMLARVLRFGAALKRLNRGARLLDVALGCGYYDQAHFDRDFRAFAGVTPTELRREFDQA